VYHATAVPAEGRTDAIESYRAADDSSIAVVTRDNAPEAQSLIKFSRSGRGESVSRDFPG